MISKQEKEQHLKNMKDLITIGDNRFFDLCEERQVLEEPKFLREFYNIDIYNETVLNELYEKYKLGGGVSGDFGEVDCNLNVDNQSRKIIKQAFETPGNLGDKQSSIKSIVLQLENLLYLNVYMDFIVIISPASSVVNKDSFFTPQNKSDKPNTEKTNCCGCILL